MHSSRMGTGLSFTVCRSLLPGGGSAPRGVSALGGCLLLGGLSVPWGVCSQAVSALGGGGCLLRGRGVSAPGEGGVCSWGECLLPGGVCSWGVSARGVVSQHALSQTPIPVNRITHTCKTLPWSNFVAQVINLIFCEDYNPPTVKSPFRRCGRGSIFFFLPQQMGCIGSNELVHTVR